VRVTFGTVADDGNAAVNDGDIGGKREGTASVIDPGMRENRLYQRLA
jgi:hypothetical protein